MGIKLGTVTNAADTSPWLPVGPGVYSVVVRGEFDGGTVTIQASNDGHSVADASKVALALGDDADFTENAARTLEIGENLHLRATMADDGASADVEIWLHPLR